MEIKKRVKRGAQIIIVWGDNLKTALDNYEVGKQKEVNADDFSYVIRGSYRFICPECLEPVTMVNGSNSKHFRHGKRNSSTVDCDRRSEENKNKSIYERVGLPLFLRKKDNKFQLTIGFRPVPSLVIDRCRSMNGSVTIINTVTSEEQKYYLNYENFSVENVVYKDVKFLSNSNLILKYSNNVVEQLLQPYWSNYIEMSINRNGALFHDGNTGGKIIRCGDCISTYKRYLWVKPQNNTSIFYEYEGLHFNKVGALNINGKIFDIFEGMFEINSEESTYFNRLANFLRRQLGVFLLDSDISITPLWPPCVRTEIGYKTKQNNDLFYLINSNNEDTVAYIYTENSPIPHKYIPEVYNNSFFGILPASKHSRNININRRVISNGTYVKSHFIGQENIYAYLGDSMEVEYHLFDDITQLNFDSIANVDAYLLDRKRNIFKQTFTSRNIKFEKNKHIIEIYLFCNNKLIAICKKNNINKLKEQSYDYLSLKNEILSSSITVEVPLNSNILNTINDLMKYDRELRKMFLPYIKRKKVPLKLLSKIGGLKR